MKFWRNHLRFLAALQLLPALESGEETLVGGQAVLEGVMMRSPHAWGIAVRRRAAEGQTQGEIEFHSEPLARPSDHHKWMGWPIVRGVATLGHAMTLGFRALRFSANVALEEEDTEAGKDTEKPVMQQSAQTKEADAKSAQPAEDKKSSKAKAEVGAWAATLNILFSLAFFIAFYKLLPLGVATL